ALAEKSYAEARTLLDGDSVEERRELARVSNNLGVLYKQLGRFDEAEKALEQALDLRRTLRQENPDRAETTQDIAATHYDQGTVLARIADQRSRACEAYREALTLQENLANGHKDNADYRRDQARTLNNLGILLHRVERKESEKAFLKAIDIYKELISNQQGV